MTKSKNLLNGCIKIARCGRALLVAIPARDFSDWEYIAEDKRKFDYIRTRDQGAALAFYNSLVPDSEAVPFF